ncbi:MAG: nitroreductase family protein [Acidimicrobiales bacterium]
MELVDALRTTGAVREFTGQPVDDATLARVLDVARFAPSGGNRQGWRVVVVKDPSARRALRELYLPGWYEYLAQSRAGLVPWAPVTDREAERRAVADADELARQASGGGGLAEELDRAPALLLLLADLRVLAAVDRDLDRYTFVGGASVYPFAWSILLAARLEGLGGVLTTMVVRREAEVKALVGAPDELAVAGLVVLGHTARQVQRLRRRPVSEFATVDRLDGAPFAP